MGRGWPRAAGRLPAGLPPVGLSLARSLARALSLSLPPAVWDPREPGAVSTCPIAWLLAACSALADVLTRLSHLLHYVPSKRSLALNDFIGIRLGHGLICASPWKRQILLLPIPVR